MNLAFRLNSGAATPPSTAAGLRTGPGGERIRAASLAVNPRICQWLHFHGDGTVEARPGKVEIGQGIITALAQIVAEELDIALEQVRMIPAATSTSPDEAVTSGSLSIQESGTALRHAAAHARALFLDAAATTLGCARERLRVENGTIFADGQGHGSSTSYSALASSVSLDVDVDSAFKPKDYSGYRIVGSAAPRRDLPEKIFGTPRLIHDLALPGMAHGRVVRPAAPGAQLESVDVEAVRALPGVIAVVRDGSFLGVVAEAELQVSQAAAALETSAKWRETRELPDASRLADWLGAQALDTKVIDQRGEAPMPTAGSTLKASYSRGFVAHASIGPSCALARWSQHSGNAQGDMLEVWTHSQGIFNLRTDLALAFARDAASIVVHHVEGAGCYGHNGADDAAYDAALLARAVPGRAVRLQWTRAQELGWAPFSPAMRVDLEATLDDAGNVSFWQHDVTSNGHGTRPGRAKIPALLAATHLAQPFDALIAFNAPLAAGGGSERNAVPLYDFPAWRITNHRLLTMPLRTSAMRSLGAHCNVFALESFVDEIAQARGEDALAFRLRHLSDARAIAVVERVALMANWPGGAAPGDACGLGMAFARYKNTGAYCAVVAEVAVARAVTVRKLWIAVDVGLVINPDGVLNQIEGGAIQAASMTLKEAVQFDRSRVTSDAWEHYPILTFSEVPAVEVDLISRPDQAAVGAGEAAHGPVAAAIANAVFNAIGVRVRDMPLTPERIISAMA